jgi:hypothetical protein
LLLLLGLLLRLPQQLCNVAAAFRFAGAQVQRPCRAC